MAKKSMIARDKKRAKLVAKYAAKRAELKKLVVDPEATIQQKMEASQALQKLPRDSSPARMRHRCEVTGRPRGYYHKFGLSRNKLRESAMRGEVPGLSLSSW